MRVRQNRKSLAWSLVVFLVVVESNTRLCLGTTVVTDGTLGKAVQIPNVGGTLTVTPDLGRIRGSNLFHSFSQFSISDGDTVNFTGPSKIQNVIARVTGGQQSDIDGTIQAIPGSSFYLINSAGVVFGPHAVLDVDNLFAVSTANYLQLKDGSRFAASQTVDPSLSSAAPAAFGFLKPHPAPITVTGDPNDSTTVPLEPNDNLSIVGGDITISAQTVVANQLTLHSLAGRGQVPVDQLSAENGGNGGTLTVTNGSAVQTLGPLLIGAGTVNVNGQSEVVSYNGTNAVSGKTLPGPLKIDTGTINVSGQSIVGSANYTAALGGNVSVDARSAVNVTDGYIAAYSYSTGRGGELHVVSPQIELDGLDDPNFTSGIFTEADSDGAAGNLTITGAKQIDVTDSAFIRANTFAAGHGGSVFVTAKSVMLSGVNGFVFTGIEANTQNGQDAADPSSDGFSGPAGNVHVHAGTLQILHGAGVVSNSLFPGAGPGGVVRVNAHNILIDGQGVDVATSIDAISGNLEQDPDGSGNLIPVAGGPGGRIYVNAANLNILDGGGIRTNTSGPENAGAIHVRANNIVVNNLGSNLLVGIGAETEDGVTGNGGAVNVSAQRIMVSNGGLISVQTNGSGSGGDAKVWADHITVASDGRIQSNSTSSGDGGDLNINVADSLRVLSGGSITASAAQGAGGDVRVSSGNSILLDDGNITTSAAQNGGSINITAPALIDLRDDSQINTNSGGGNGGNISVDPLELTLLDASSIHANGFGTGGKITLNADRRTGVVTQGATPNVTAFGGLQPGTIVAAPEQLDLIGSLVPLRTELETTAALIPQCAAQFDNYQSSFVVTGRGGTPVEPGGWLPDLSLAPGTDTTKPTSP
jgi:filamentous hemagglutinin family protein